MNHINTLRIPAYLALIGLLLLSGCATTQGAQGLDDERDPLEGVNRAVYSFNDGLDKAIFKPVATGYRAVLPQPVRTSISNFFDNLAYPVVILNSVLQGKISQGISDTGRFLTNSTVGVLGLFDPATPLGMQAHDEDFGQTLAIWGLGEGPYLVLPVLGPSTIRDTAGLVVDYQADILNHHPEVRERNAAWAVKATDNRSELLSAGRILEQAAIDPYSFTREAYRQRRNNLIHDGNAPREDLLNNTTQDIDVPDNTRSTNVTVGGAQTQ